MLANAVDQLISISEERQHFNIHHCFRYQLPSTGLVCLVFVVLLAIFLLRDLNENLDLGVRLPRETARLSLRVRKAFVVAIVSGHGEHLM